VSAFSLAFSTLLAPANAHAHAHANTHAHAHAHARARAPAIRYSSRVDAFDFSDPASGAYSYSSELSAERADLAAARSGSSEAMFVGGMDDGGVVDVVDTWSPSEFRATGGSAESAVF